MAGVIQVDEDHTESTRWLGPLSVGLDSFVRVAEVGKAQQDECQFWVHGRPDKCFSIESFDGRYLRMWLWRLVSPCRPLDELGV